MTIVGTPTRRRRRETTYPADKRVVAQRAHLPRRNVEELAADQGLLSTASTSAGWRPNSESKSRLQMLCFDLDALCHWPCRCYPNYALG
jgi:hypothetical protein